MLLNPYRFGAPSGAGPYRYWRVYITANDGDATYTSIGNCNLFDGPTDRSNAYVATDQSSSNGGSETAAAAFNDALTNEWVTAAGQSVPSWIACDLGAQYTIDSFKIRAQRIVSPGTRTPRTFELQGNNTSLSSGAPWVTVKSLLNETGWTTLEQRTYTVP